ncbi:hypothetical protein BM1374166_01915 [Bartonella tribocorum]|nr:hypothetical protein BM1374166_01915 [Bartonella tribocorum]
MIARVFLFLKSFALICLLGFILGLAYVGVKHLDVPWHWVLNEWGSICIFVFLVHFMSTFFHEATLCVGVMLDWFLKRMGFLLTS